MISENWVISNPLSFISDPDLLPLYDMLGKHFDDVRKAKSLDNDAYLELICTFVQSIPYETDAMLVAPKFPIETIADGKGDCDDKSLLLAALLAREGYAVALLYFETEQHMAVGVIAPGYSYGDSGYAYIEATNVSYIGIPPDELTDGLILSSEPHVIPVGSGTLGYGRCDETFAIDEALTRAKAVIAYNPEDHGAMKSSIDAYNRQVGIHNYIITHVHDRPGTYAWLVSTGA
ncbi:MAG: hypothetical protein JXA08_09085 [Methanomicrobiaceae archaeon]|nr:hypothetical protein [Methanomicrobiaceae archaeon]